MIIDKEDFEVQKSNTYWAGRLIDLPKDQAWEIATEIMEAIEYAQANENKTSSESTEVCTAEGYNCEHKKDGKCYYDEACNAREQT